MNVRKEDCPIKKWRWRKSPHQISHDIPICREERGNTLVKWTKKHLKKIVPITVKDKYYWCWKHD